MHVVAGKPSVAVKETGIYWAPVSKSVRITFEGTDQETVARALKAVFGEFPIRLSASNLSVVQAMGAASVAPAYFQIADALEKFGELELTEA